MCWCHPPLLADDRSCVAFVPVYCLHPVIIASLLLRLSSPCNHHFPAKQHFLLTNNRTGHLSRLSISPPRYRFLVVSGAAFCTCFAIACPLALPLLPRVLAGNNNLEISNNPEVPCSGVALLYFAAQAQWVVDISESSLKGMVWQNLEWRWQKF